MEPHTEDGTQVNVRQRLYKPLLDTEYRVIHLLPGRFLDEIQCVLETRSFRVKTRYEAISYQWGNVPNTKPVRIAYLTPHPSPPEILTTALPVGATKVLEWVSIALQAIGKWYIVPSQIFFWFLGNMRGRFLWLRVLEVPRWMPSSIFRLVYMALLCILIGGKVIELLGRAIKLVIELAETKPWFSENNLRTIPGRKQGSEEPLEFETLQVTPNLELGLRYLRRETRTRALWIDALCINQKDEKEKSIQIQRMQWIYANASPIVVWLGGYHGIGEDVCAGSLSQKRIDCEHRRDIQAAFGYIWTQNDWRVVFGLFFNRKKKEISQKALSGLCELARRGWWERLWVIQEVALATGRIQIQCGNNTCDFEDFTSAECAMLKKHNGEKALTEGFRSSENFRETVKGFCYSSFHDRGGVLAKTMSKLLMNGFGMFFRDIGADVPRFHELSFAQRLHLILLKTSGRFKCFDDRDRLHAVLGIAGGAATGEVTQTASLIETISLPATRHIIWKNLDPLWSQFSGSVKVAYLLFAITWSLWGHFYDFRAKHWTFNRPHYVVAGHREIIDAVTTESGERRSGAEYFTAIARYLANETGSLAFLDAATCTENTDERMPSWVPNWTREISKPAYDFANRIKKNQPRDSIGFTDRGTTIQLYGLSKGTVNILRAVDLDRLQSSPWEGAFEKMLVLPPKAKDAVACSLRLIGIIMENKCYAILSKGELEVISYSVSFIESLLDAGLVRLRDQLLGEGGATIVYSYDIKAGEMGILRAGKVVEGDQLVFVPGCFHSLLLRSQDHTAEFSARWKLVGLIEMSTMTTQGRRCYSESEWAQLHDDGAVYEYSIE